MAHPVPSLDGSGFITDAALKIDAIFANYAATQYSQTVLYRNRISSFSKDIQVCSQQWQRLAEVMQQSLSRLFTAYFDQTDITVELDESSMNDETATFQMFISGSVIQDNTSYNLSKVLQVTNAKFSSVTDFNMSNIPHA